MPRPRPHPQIAKYVRHVSSRTRYPIRNLTQLVDALGADTEIEFDGPRGKVRSVLKVLPKKFFPVKTEEDLLEKSEALRVKYMER